MDNNEANSIIVDTLIKAAVNKNVLDELDEYKKIEEALPEHVFSDSYNKKMHKLIEDNKKKHHRKNIFWFTGRAAVILLVFAISSTALGMVTVQAFRIKVLQMIQNFTQEYFIFIPEETNNPFADLESLKHILEVNLPAGLIETNSFISDNRIVWRYTSDDEQFMHFSTSVMDEFVFKVASDDESYELNTINNIQVYTIEKGNVNTVVWYDNNYTYTINSTFNISDLLVIVDELTK